MSQNVIAVGDGIHNHPESIDVVQLVHGLALGLHLAVDGVNVLDPAVGLVVDTHAGQTLGDLLLNGAHEHLVLFFVGSQVIRDFLIGVRHQIPQGDVLQLPLDLLHTKAVRQRRVDVHGFPALLDLLFRGLVLHGAHIVQPVGDFNEHHPHVLGHGHEHFAQVFHLRLLGGGEASTGQLGDAFYQLRHGGAEDFFDLLVGSVGVLDTVVEQRAQNGILIQTHFCHNLRHGKGVNDVGGAVFALLHPVLDISVVNRLVNQGDIRAGHVFCDG